MHDAFHIKSDEGLDNLSKDEQNIARFQRFVIIDVVMNKIASFTILHYNFQFFIFLVVG